MLHASSPGLPSHSPVTEGHRPTRSSTHTVSSDGARAQQLASTSGRPPNHHAAGAGNRDTHGENAIKTPLYVGATVAQLLAMGWRLTSGSLRLWYRSEEHLLDDALDSELLQFVEMILS